MKKFYPLIILVAIFLLQLIVPLSTVLGEQMALSQGSTLRVPVRSIDPYDPLRGRYLNLQLDLVLPEGNYQNGRAWLVLEPGQETLGASRVVYPEPEVAEMVSVVYLEPSPEQPSLEVFIRRDWQGGDDDNIRYRADFPGEVLRFYLREDLALKAEKILANPGANSGEVTGFELEGSVLQGRFRAIRLLHEQKPFD